QAQDGIRDFPVTGVQTCALPIYSNTYFNMSNGQDVRGPWNEGVSPGLNEVWQYIDDPIEHVKATNGLLDQEIEGTDRTEALVKELNETLSKERREEIEKATETEDQQWSTYDATESPGR